MKISKQWKFLKQAIENLALAITIFDLYINKALIDLCKLNKSTNRGVAEQAGFQLELKIKNGYMVFGKQGYLY